MPLSQLKGRIDRCLMDCQDSVRNEKDEDRARKLFDGCAERCVVRFVPVVPEVIKTLCEALEKVKRDSGLT